jgi:hypothetical protein
MNKLLVKYFKGLETTRPVDSIILGVLFLAASIGFSMYLNNPTNKVIEIQEVKRLILQYDSVVVETHYGTVRSGRRESISIDLYSRNSKFRIWDDIWEDSHTTNNVITTLKSSESAVIYYSLRDPFRVLGFDVKNISISPLVGIGSRTESYSLTRIFSLCIGVMGLSFLLSPFVLKRMKYNKVSKPA